MKRRKTCLVCHELYSPYPRSYRRQKICSNLACQRAWARHLWVQWREKNPLGVGVSRAKSAKWAEGHPGYWKQWRKAHPGYVERNRMAQEERNRTKRSVIAKPKGLEGVHRRKLRRMSVIAKTKGIAEAFPVIVDDVVSYLGWFWLIAKTKEMDAQGLGVGKWVIQNGG
jgi:hypothetical protein